MFMPHLLSRLFCILGALLALSGCGERATNPHTDGQILVMGDSLMAWNRASQRAISDVMEQHLEIEVTDRSVIGARMIYRLPISGAAGLSIPKQLPKRQRWDWVVLNGGGNDLWLGCGCTACRRKMDRLSSIDGSSGAIPDLVNQLRSSGAKVIYTGYLRSPGRGSPIEYCKDDGEELDRRAARMAEQDEGVFFLSLADTVPHGDRSFHALDMIHPSIKGSDAIGTRISELIKTETETSAD
ncbi:MAG: GDSL family lipase [Roseobacter sp. MedPE-SW]|nr:MAG: GDSL family lipase [Roseobacter sp. MedPE-SW]